jgi:voltage-gated potassium channel
VKRRVYEILTTPDRDDHIGRAINGALLVLIAVNVAASVLQTDAAIARTYAEPLAWFERISVAVFTVEYIARLWSCSSDLRYVTVAGRLRYVLGPMMLIDLAAIAPFYVELLWPGVLDLRFLRVLRLLRVFRLFRVGRVGNAFALLTRVIRQKRYELGVTLALVLVAMLLAAGGIYAAEHDEPNTAFTSIPRAMWWSIVTITTVGYGDMYPTTPIGQLIGGVVAFIGICALALPVGLLSSGFVDELNKHEAEEDRKDCPHCGRSLG